MLVKPIINPIKTYDAKNEYPVTFTVIGGSQVVANELTIERIKDNKLVYKQKISSLTLLHRLSGNVLENGVGYRAKLVTYDAEGNVSPNSDTVIFYCFSKPVITVTNIDNQNRVNNQTVLFKSIYEQAENETLQAYRYILYNSNREILEQFPQLYSDGKEPLLQEITGLENGKQYFLEVKTTSPNGNTGTTGLLKFTPFYLAPKINVALNPINTPSEGGIRLDANIVQVFIDVYDEKDQLIPPEKIEFVDNDFIDLNKKEYSYLKAGKGFFSSSGNYVAKMWIDTVPDNSEIILITTDNGFNFNFIRSGNYIYCEVTHKNLNIIQRFRSNEIPDWKDEQAMIYIKAIDGLIDLVIERVE